MKLRTKRNCRISVVSKKILMFSFIVLFFVCVLHPLQISSASFQYQDFDWDTFKDANKEYWSGYCKDAEDKSTCEDLILKQQEKFYKKLYKLLAKYQEEGLYINDNIIIETVFIDMTPSDLTDTGEEYKASWRSFSGSYAIDESEMDTINIEDNYDADGETTANYYEEEKDTLKMLIKNMIAYNTGCYGVYGNPKKEILEDNSERLYCEEGALVDLPARGYSKKTKCADRLSSYEYGFWEYFSSKWAHDEKLPRNAIMGFLRRLPKDEKYEDCQNIGANYPEKSTYVYDDNPHVSTDRYFDFLSQNIYFDKKAHLQERFKKTVLEPAGVKCMTNDVCSDSLEARGLYDDYEEQIVIVRKRIIDDIIDILNDYGLNISYNESGGESEFIEVSKEESTRKSFYWPIGSRETEKKNGVLFADKDPVSTNIVSYFGTRTNPVTKEEEINYGIDISAPNGTNVIAVYSGEVVSIINSCTVGDYDCNEGYGNMIVLSHTNGDYTVYAHLHDIYEITVGDTVLQGQVIGHVGHTGRTNDDILHFELRKGGADVSFAVDVLNYMSASNPRPKLASGDFSVHQTSLTKAEFVSKMRTYCNNHSCSSKEMKVFLNVFVGHAEEVYDVSVANNVNPELVVIRAISEGFSPGISNGSNNYWGIRCYNGKGTKVCSQYRNLEEGIKGFAATVSSYENASDMMMKYAYIGKYWVKELRNSKGNIDWGIGGCAYYPYIKKYMAAERASVVGQSCSEAKCEKDGSGSCIRSTDEDQKAYALWQVNDKMSPTRHNLFGL